MPDAQTIDALAGIDIDALRDWVEEQRWYASKSRHVTSVELVESATVREKQPRLVIALLQTGFATGTHELYQLPVGVRPAGEDGPGTITETDQWTLYDALSDPQQGRELLRQIDAQSEIATDEGLFSFHRANGALDLGDEPDVRPMGVEQSNSSLVFADRLAMKVFRKVEPGLNPELEMLRFLTARGFPNIAPLYGWCEYQGEALTATLLVTQRFLPDGTGGWELALDEIATDPDAFLDRLGGLGGVTAQMHTVLASDASDPAFSPEEPSEESLSLLTATLDEDIDRLFSRLPDDERLDPIRGRGQDVQERLSVLSKIGAGGRMIRTHGDFHLGQTLMTPRGWVILDFEGEPARPLHERRQKRSPLRDVAGMLRSFAYVSSAAEMQRGTPAPEGWEERARGAFLDHYLDAVEANLLPMGEAAVANLLSVFELEKAVYELRYELDNRPDWVPIPVAGIERILQEDG
jgi:trehalose synthase-fused probable maltokinase